MKRIFTAFLIAAFVLMPMISYGAMTSSNTELPSLNVAGDATIGGTLEVTGVATISDIAGVDSITMADDAWIGLGVAEGRIVFEDAATDIIRILGDVKITEADADLQMGSNSTNAGDFIMIMGDETSDPQLSVSMSDDANGDVTFDADTGDGIFESAANRQWGVVRDTWVEGSFTGTFNVIGTSSHLYSDIALFSDSITQSPKIRFSHSHSDTMGTLVETIDNEILGTIEFLGIESGTALGAGASITVIQDGAAGAGEVPTEMILATYSSTAINANQLLLDGPTNTIQIASGLVGTPDEITAVSGAGTAASLTTLNTEVTTNDDNDLDVVTLANGTSGQIKHIYCVASFAGDTWNVTPDTMLEGTQISFGDNSVGTGCTLVYADNEGWIVVSNNGGTIA